MHSSRLIEVAPSRIWLNEVTEEPSVIYDHLRYFYAKFSPIPAINAIILGENIIPTRDGVRAQISLDLGRSTQRVIVSASEFEVLRKSGIQFWELDFDKEIADFESGNVNGFHVFFLEREASRQDAEALLDSLYMTLKRFGLEKKSFSNYFNEKNCCEIFFESRLIAEFSNFWLNAICNHAKIIRSYNGKLWRIGK